MQFVSEGARLFAEQIGGGPDVVVLHPTPVDHTFWLPVARVLGQAFRVWMPDLRGHGRSELGYAVGEGAGGGLPRGLPRHDELGAMTVRGMARDIVAMLDQARIERALFVGCSIGGYLVYELWRQIPERMVALAICCGKPQADSVDAHMQRAKTIEEIERRGTGPFFERMLATLVGEPTVRRHPAILSELRRMMERMQPAAVIATQHALAERPDSVRTAATIRVPTLVMAGALDVASTPAEMKQLAEVVPNVQFHLLEGVGHYAPYEDPAAVASLLRPFCDGVLW
jgi:pimeloyl-ACP methyl ester carboxylesterase